MDAVCRGSYGENGGYSTYNAFQTKAEIRAWHGLTLLSSYAFAKSIDNLSADVQGYSSQDSNNNNGEKGVSDFYVKQRWVTSINYSLPFGKTWRGPVGYLVRDWELGSIITAQSGLPFTPSNSTDSANTGTSLRPNRIASGKLETRTLSRYFDPSAFSIPAQYTLDNSGPNILYGRYGRGFRNWYFIAVRNFRIREPLVLQFRSEFFNFTNTPAFGQPTANIQSPTVGQILSAGEPRDIQLALKLMF